MQGQGQRDRDLLLIRNAPQPQIFRNAHSDRLHSFHSLLFCVMLEYELFSNGL